jgi:hypothetical protein
MEIKPDKSSKHDMFRVYESRWYNNFKTNCFLFILYYMQTVVTPIMKLYNEFKDDKKYNV